MAGLQLLSDEGFRTDGRRPNELRRLRCKIGVFTQADGSAYFEMGNTKVLAAVYGPHEVRTVPWKLENLQDFRKIIRCLELSYKWNQTDLLELTVWDYNSNQVATINIQNIAKMVL